ncbi:MAG: hypothetical protein WDZ72_12980 [Cyclobacteriaceae bacterium]
MRKTFNLLFVLLGLAVVISCGDDEQPNSLVTISGIPPTAVIEAGGMVGPVTANISAPDGLNSLVIQKDGSQFETVNFTGETSGTYEFSYTATDEDANKNLVFQFTATDSNGDTQSVTHVLTVGEASTVIRVAENIEADVTWETGNVYILGGRIAVKDGNTLKIEPGVIVKGEAGSGANATALIIARGAKIDAQGTAEQPIIFTSIADEIEPGMIASPNLDPDLEGLWGGVLVLGRAKGAFAGDVTEIQIEGIPPSDTDGLYGGDDPEDDSGILRYISIRHGGANIGEGNEINGLTLGGVGSTTIVENIEVIANQDDGIEWFGGTVNVTNALVWNSADDALDTDQSWSGTMDNFILLCGPNTDHAFEIDGPEGTFNAAHTLTNGTVVGSSAAEMGDFRDGARATLENIYFFGFPNPADTDGRGDLSLSGDTSLDNFENGILNFNNLEVTLADGVSLTDAFRNGSHVNVTEVALGENTVGADKTAFEGWTWAAAAGLLDDL